MKVFNLSYSHVFVYFSFSYSSSKKQRLFCSNEEKKFGIRTPGLPAEQHEGTTKMHYVLILIITNILIYSVPVTSIMCLTIPTEPPITHFCSSFSSMAWWEELKWLFPYVRSSFQPQMRRAHMEPAKVKRNLKCWKGFSRNVKCHRDVNGSRM